MVGEGCTGKALDDRVAVYVMLKALQGAKRFASTTCAVATVQEEVGLRGAGVSAYGLEADAGIALDVTIAADIPGVPEHEQVTRLGKGVAIKLLDSASISHPGLFARLRELAVRRQIPHQVEILPRGGTDAGAMQRARAGMPVVTLSVPTRYVHTSVELAARTDIEAAVALLTAFLEEGDLRGL
jgi:endoglucanase